MKTWNVLVGYTVKRETVYYVKAKDEAMAEETALKEAESDVAWQMNEEDWSEEAGPLEATVLSWGLADKEEGG